MTLMFASSSSLIWGKNSSHFQRPLIPMMNGILLPRTISYIVGTKFTLSIKLFNTHYQRPISWYCEKQDGNSKLKFNRFKNKPNEHNQRSSNIKDNKINKMNNMGFLLSVVCFACGRENKICPCLRLFPLVRYAHLFLTVGLV